MNAVGGDGMERLLGRFNSQYETCVFALLDEVGTDKLTPSQEEKLKSLVTDLLRQIEEKFGPNKLSKNHLNIFVLSNHDNAVPDRPGGRRNEYSRCSEELNLKEYKRTVIARIRTKFAAMCLGYFLHCAKWLDLVDVHSKAYFNDEKKRVMLRNLDSVPAFWHEKVLMPQSFPPLEHKKDAQGLQYVPMFSLGDRGYPYPLGGDDNFVTNVTSWCYEAPLPLDWSHRHTGSIRCWQDMKRLPFCRVPEAYLYEAYGIYCKDASRNSGRDLTKKDLVSFLADLRQLVDYGYDANDPRFIRLPCREACEAMFETYLRTSSCCSSDSESDGWIKILSEQGGMGVEPGGGHGSCLQCGRSSRTWAQFAQCMPDYLGHVAPNKHCRPVRTSEAVALYGERAQHAGGQ